MAMRGHESIPFVINGPIARSDIPGLCDRAGRLFLASGDRIVRCDVRDIDVDAVTVDALARLQLAARRHGCQIRLWGASERLRDLVAFMGLEDVLPA